MKIYELFEESGLSAADIKYYRGLSNNINSLAKRVDLKDIEKHESAVASLASILAKNLMLPVDSRVKVTQAAKIHDIGKLVVPKEILDADRSLTADERTKYINKHPEVGAKILISAGFPQWLADLVRDHHREKAGGYPRINDYLTFCAQILHVADVAVSVGTTDPNHKYVHDSGIKKAIDILKHPGFNQEIVDVFKSLVSSKKLPSIFYAT